MFSHWGWFCSEKVYPQTSRAYYLFSYIITCSLLYVCEGVWYTKMGCCEGVWYKESGFIVRVFGYGKLP